MSHLLVEQSGPVLSITMNRPESLNAFSAEMIVGITEALRMAEANEEIKAVILSGAGRSFSAGGDVKTMGQVNGQQIYEHLGKLNECILAIKNLSKPVIAAVHGFAAGAAFNLALACDFIFAAEDSKFVMSFAQVGLISDGGGLYFLPRLIGPQRAKELFFNAEPIDAETAKSYGIVNHTVPLQQLKDEVSSYAFRLSQGPLQAFGQMKRIIEQASYSRLEDILEQERLTQPMMIETADHQEGVLAFKEKRKPEFQGK
ncbi:enoyl-CoA hydratase [Metabacillus sp. KIGAM252]|uniref:Enoyl-CoA hydratase n=1 Tax=Metabacillus flavus TaxID=2823519 RepID=A0ABS5LHP6_9BACI|nr:enoyl-CoA hydratase [Metabacillus flavus]MBS2970088.1 enoyl-CoA hydratase [Metabacillus flavus]